MMRSYVRRARALRALLAEPLASQPAVTLKISHLPPQASWSISSVDCLPQARPNADGADKDPAPRYPARLLECICGAEHEIKLRCIWLGRANSLMVWNHR